MRPIDGSGDYLKTAGVPVPRSSRNYARALEKSPLKKQRRRRAADQSDLSSARCYFLIVNNRRYKWVERVDGPVPDLLFQVWKSPGRTAH